MITSAAVETFVTGVLKGASLQQVVDARKNFEDNEEGNEVYHQIQELLALAEIKLRAEAELVALRAEIAKLEARAAEATRAIEYLRGINTDQAETIKTLMGPRNCGACGTEMHITLTNKGE